MSRLPIRLRLTAAFAAAMAALLAGAGFFLYQRVDSTLSRGIDQRLRVRATDLSALVRQTDTGLRESGRSSSVVAGPAQILSPSGRIVDRTAGTGSQPMLDARQRAAARHRTILVDGRDELRLIATPVRAQDQQLLVVVGASADQAEAALASLRSDLYVGGPAALVAAALLAFVLASRALRPVEQLRRRAARIEGEPGERLPVPKAKDEIARLGSTLNEMLERLESALEHERAFVADASHELRTPLTMLKAEIELALEGPRDPETLQGALTSAAEETDRLVRMAEDLLLLTRADRGALSLRLETVASDELLEGVCARFRRRVEAAGRELHVETIEVESLVEVDRLRLEQAVSNLIENALRHGEGRIGLSIRAAQGVEVHVKDEGQGFAPGFAPRAFERFSRPAGSWRTEGAGLGLAIVAAVAEAHGGAAHAANLEQGGADVWLTLPLAQAPSAAGQSGHRGRRLAGAA